MSDCRVFASRTSCRRRRGIAFSPHRRPPRSSTTLPGYRSPMYVGTTIIDVISVLAKRSPKDRGSCDVWPPPVGRQDHFFGVDGGRYAVWRRTARGVAAVAVTTRQSRVFCRQHGWMVRADEAHTPQRRRVKRIGSRPTLMGGQWWRDGWTAVVVATTVWLWLGERAVGEVTCVNATPHTHTHARTHAHARNGERAHAHRQLGTDFCTSKRHRVYYNTLLEKPTTLLLLLLPLVLLLLLLLPPPPRTRSLTYPHARSP